MYSTKFHGSYEDQLELIFSQVVEHRKHFLYFNLLDLDFAEIHCGACKKTVISGTRELIELIWLECNSLGSSS
jgi:hypothetical protein